MTKPNWQKTEDRTQRIRELVADRDFWKAEAARDQRNAAVSQEEAGKLLGEVDRLAAENARLREAVGNIKLEMADGYTDTDYQCFWKACQKAVDLLAS